jgi:mannose-1-phosphate guanylyltransferase
MPIKLKAILLAAGLGTRLRPITDRIPKCLVPVKGIPLLGIWLNSLHKNNIGPYLINTHYLADQVEAFITASDFHNSVVLVNEVTLLGTAGTLKKNLDFFDGNDGLLIHADNYCLANFQEFVDAHRCRPSGCLMTMMTFKTDNPSACGVVELNKDNIVISFYEKQLNPPSNIANGAIYILSMELINQFKTIFKDAVDFSNDVIPNLMGKIYAYETREPLIDIGTVENYSRVK